MMISEIISLKSGDFGTLFLMKSFIWVTLNFFFFFGQVVKINLQKTFG